MLSILVILGQWLLLDRVDKLNRDRQADWTGLSGWIYQTVTSVVDFRIKPIGSPSVRCPS